MKNFATSGLAFVCIFSCCVTDASADMETITFEDQGLVFGESAFLPSVSTATTRVTFSVLENVNSGALPSDRVPALAKAGPSPIKGFQNLIDGPDIPDQTSPLVDNGIYFITNGARSPYDLGDYGMAFDQLVNNVSLLLYDYIGDGNTGDGNPGVDSVTLFGYDAGQSIVDSMTWVVPNPRPNDGHVVRMALDPSARVRSIKLQFNGFDFGTGVDNLSFQVVPEPTSCSGLLIGLLMSLALRRAR